MPAFGLDGGLDGLADQRADAAHFVKARHNRREFAFACAGQVRPFRHQSPQPPGERDQDRLHEDIAKTAERRERLGIRRTTAPQVTPSGRERRAKPGAIGQAGDRVHVSEPLSAACEAARSEMSEDRRWKKTPSAGADLGDGQLDGKHRSVGPLGLCLHPPPEQAGCTAGEKGRQPLRMGLLMHGGDDGLTERAAQHILSAKSEHLLCGGG